MSLLVEAQIVTPDEEVKKYVHPKYIEDLNDQIIRVQGRLLIFEIVNSLKDPEESLFGEVYRFYQKNISAFAANEVELERIFKLDLIVAHRFESRDPTIEGPIKTLPDLISFENERRKELEEELESFNP